MNLDLPTFREDKSDTISEGDFKRVVDVLDKYAQPPHKNATGQELMAAFVVYNFRDEFYKRTIGGEKITLDTLFNIFLCEMPIYKNGSSDVVVKAYLNTYFSDIETVIRSIVMKK